MYEKKKALIQLAFESNVIPESSYLELKILEKDIRRVKLKQSHLTFKALNKVNEDFHNFMENRKKNAEDRVNQLKNQALKDIKNTSVRIAIESVEKLLKNSLDKSKLDKIYTSSIEETKLALKKKSS